MGGGVKNACQICNAPDPSRGYGYAGFRSERKSEAILWVCASPACIAAAEVRWRAANTPIGRSDSAPSRAPDEQGPGTGGDLRQDKHHPQQGALDL